MSERHDNEDLPKADNARPGIGAMLAARGPPPGPTTRPDFGAMLASRGPPPGPAARPDLSAMLAARGPPPPRPDLGAMLGARGPPPPGMGGLPPRGLFGIGGLPPRGGPFGGGGLSGHGGVGGVGGLLPKKAAPPPPQPLGVLVPTDADGRGLTPTARLRGLDALRLHVPLDAERAQLKLPGGDRDRLPVGPDLKTLLLFCGAARGVRFATAELRELTALAADAEAAYASADASYKQLSAAARKRSLPPNAFVAKHTPREPEAAAADDSGLDMESYVAPSAAQVLAEEAAPAAASVGACAVADDLVAAEAVAFHATADAYCAAFRALACGFVGRKQREVPAGSHQEIVLDKDHGEGLSAAKPFPHYLQTLLDKYKTAAGPGGGASKSGGAVNSLGALATFVGCCLFLQQPNTPAELDALEVLVLASDDGSGANLESLPCFRAAAASNSEPPATAAATAHEAGASARAGPIPPPPGLSPESAPVPPAPSATAEASLVETASDAASFNVATSSNAAPQAGEAAEADEAAAPGARKAVDQPMAFWARRVFAFLAKVRELKSAPKDEKALCDPALVAMWSV